MRGVERRAEAGEVVGSLRNLGFFLVGSGEPLGVLSRCPVRAMHFIECCNAEMQLIGGHWLVRVTDV